jgi:hypothetical protein
MTTEYPGVEDDTPFTHGDLPELTEQEYRDGVTEERTCDAAVQEGPA